MWIFFIKLNFKQECDIFFNILMSLALKYVCVCVFACLCERVCVCVCQTAAAEITTMSHFLAERRATKLRAAMSGSSCKRVW